MRVEYYEKSIDNICDHCENPNNEIIVEKKTGELLKITDYGEFIIKTDNGFIRTLNKGTLESIGLRIIE